MASFATYKKISDYFATLEHNAVITSVAAGDGVKRCTYKAGWSDSRVYRDLKVDAPELKRTSVTHVRKELFGDMRSWTRQAEPSDLDALRERVTLLERSVTTILGSLFPDSGSLFPERGSLFPDPDVDGAPDE